MRARGLMAVACLTVLYASPAHAYLDPGTGSIILQGLLAGIAAAMAAAMPALKCDYTSHV